MGFSLNRQGPLIVLFVLLIGFFIISIIVFSYTPENDSRFSPLINVNYDYTVDEGIMSLSIENDFGNVPVLISIYGSDGSEEFNENINLGENLIILDVSSVGEISDVGVLPLI
jgi:hypothetical protein